MAKVPVVVVGTGFGCRVHVPALRAAGFEVVGLVGATPERLAVRAEKAGISATFTDLDEAIVKTGAKAVTISTPPGSHAELTLTAVARGCHVLCEKPFAMNVAQARAMVEAAERASVVNMVSHELRWLPERVLFGKAIRDGLIGEPRFLVMDQFLAFTADPSRSLGDWWFDASQGGGWLGASGSHQLDQIRVWLGDIASLSGSLFLTSDRQADADDTFSLRLRTRGGVEVSMQQTAGAWGPPATLWRCAGTKGTVWLDKGQVFLADKEGARELEMPAGFALPPAPASPDGTSPGFEVPAFVRLCEHFHAAITGGTLASAVPVPTFRDGLAVMEMMDAIRASSAEEGALQRLV